MRCAAAVACTLLALAGCAAPRPDPSVRAPAFGSGSYAYGTATSHHTTHHSAAWYRAHHLTYHSTRSTRATSHGHRAAPTGPPEDFATRTRARCDAGDAGACRMLQAMGQ